MAEEKENKTVLKKEEKGKDTAPAVYQAHELAKRSLRFGTTPEVVMAALRQGRKKEASIKETEELVKKFLRKEIK